MCNIVMILMYFDCRGDASEQGQTRDGERVRVTYTTVRRRIRVRTERPRAATAAAGQSAVAYIIIIIIIIITTTYTKTHSHVYTMCVFYVYNIILLCHPSGDPRRGARRTIGKLSYFPTA